VGELLRRGLLAAGVPAERVVPGVYSEEESVLKSLAAARPGDLVVIFGEQLSRCWDLIVGFKKAEREEDDSMARRPRRRAVG
jgi:cyanophycin synthetase